MNKEILKNDCLQILSSDYEDGGLKNSGIYGLGELLENMVEDLVPYLSREGLLYLKKELLSIRSSEDRY